MGFRDRLRAPFVRLLPAPAPLPSLQTAFSRRAALFGAVTLTGAVAGSAVAAVVPRPSVNDDHLAQLGADLAHTLADTDHALQPSQNVNAQNARLTRADEILSDMATVPAGTHAGIASKAEAYLACDQFDVQNNYTLGVSMARDVLRLDGDGR